MLIAPIARVQWGHTTFRSGYEPHIFKRAELLCERRLTAQDSQADLLHLRGLLAARSKKDDFAIACLRRATELEATNAEYWSDLGDVLSHARRGEEAVQAYHSAIGLASESGDLYCRLAQTLVMLRRLPEALAQYQEALRRDPTNARTHTAIGDLLRMQNRWQDASVYYQQAVELDGEDPDTHRRLGSLHMHRKEWDLALACFRRGLVLHPSNIELHVDVGEALLKGGAFQEAWGALRTAWAIGPKHVRACRLLVKVCERLGLVDDSANAWCRLAEALEAEHRLPQAVRAYRKAIARRPDCRTLENLGQLHLILAQPEEAQRCFLAALALDRDAPFAHARLGWASLQLGDYAKGWEEYVWIHALSQRRTFAQPAWDGSPLAGRTILLWADLALGDAVQHARYFPTIKALGARVIVECHSDLVTTLAGVAGVDEVVARGAPLPPFDVHAPFLWLPRLFHQSCESIPASVPYLTVPESLRAHWRERLGPSDGRVIGIVWASDPTHWQTRFRAASLAAFQPLGRVPHLRIVSLQWGAHANELVAPPEGLRVERLLDDTCTIADTAALMLNLDLVVTVDTMPAHLAGALAKPVWLLAASRAPAWWLSRDGDRSSWYPTMRVFRQRRAGDWPDVLERVRAALEAIPSTGVFEHADLSVMSRGDEAVVSACSM
jgi:tetratricopeptide (TPR) repeat protein